VRLTDRVMTVLVTTNCDLRSHKDSENVGVSSLEYRIRLEDFHGTAIRRTLKSVSELGCSDANCGAMTI